METKMEWKVPKQGAFEIYFVIWCTECEWELSVISIVISKSPSYECLSVLLFKALNKNKMLCLLNACLKWQWATGSAVSAAVVTQRSLKSASRASAAARSVVWVKMASSFWKGVVGVGLFALAHAAFSAAQRKYRQSRSGR